MKKNIAIFASGSGTNAENLIRYFREHEGIRVALVLSNRKEAFVLERAKRLGVEHRYLPKENWVDGREVGALLESFRIDFIVLAGFLLRVPSLLIDKYPRRMVNIHPALLPKYGGKGMYGNRVHEAVVAAGETETGITIHYVNEGYDEGSIICQETCSVLPGDTPEQVAARVHALEYRYYPKVVEQLLQRSFSEEDSGGFLSSTQMIE